MSSSSTSNQGARSEAQLAAAPQSSGRRRLQSEASGKRGPKISEWKLFVVALFSQKYFIGVIVLLSLLLGWAALLVLPRTYESESQLLVRIGRESIALDPTATTSQTLMLQKTQEEEVNSAIEVLRSRRISERVVNKIGAENILNGYLPSEGGGSGPPKESLLVSMVDGAKKRVNSTLLALGIKDDLSDEELAIMRLGGSTDVGAERGTTVVTITASAETPDLARAIAQTTAEEFIEESLSITHNSGASVFFLQQVEQANEELERLSNKRVLYLQEKQVVDVSAKRQILVSQLGDIEGEMIAMEASLEQVKAEMADVEKKLEVMPVEIVASKSENTGSTWSQMRQSVYQLEIQEKELAAVYVDGSAKLERVREQLKGAREILSKFEGGGGVDRSTTPNPMRKSLEEVLQQLDTRKVGLEAGLSKKKSQHAEVKQEIGDLLDAELVIDDMDRDIAAAKTRLQMLRTKLEEARIGDELQSERISNLSLFQPATLVERASSPNKKLLALGCLVLGLTSGVSLGFVREFNSRKLRSRYAAAARMPAELVTQLGAFGRKADPLTLMKDIHSQPAMVAEVQSLVSDIQANAERDSDAIQCQTVGVIGLANAAGSTSIAATAASVAAKGFGLETILIDADGHTDSCLTELCSLRSMPGLLEVIRGESNYEECLQAAAQKRLMLVSSSNADSGDQLWLEPPKSIVGAVECFSRQCDTVFVDLPSVEKCEGSFAVAQQMDYVIVVLEAGRTLASEAERFVNRLKAAGQPRVAVVVNKCSGSTPRWLVELLNLPV